MICGSCGAAGSFSPIVACVVVYAPSLPGGCFVIIPDMEGGGRYRICDGRGCGAPMAFLVRAIASHRVTREAEDWTHGVFVFVDPRVHAWMIERHATGETVARA